MAVEQQLRAYVDYLRDMGIYDLYRRESSGVLLPDALRTLQTALQEKRTGAEPVRAAVSAPRKAEPVGQKLAMIPVTTAAQELSIEAEPTTSMPKPPSLDVIAALPDGKIPVGERAAALDELRAAIGECTRCPLAYAGRRNIVFGEGNPSARLMFVGEGPGADEDESGRPFVGKAGQLLNNMISAMGLKREDVYIANIVKCRPSANRAPEYVEVTTCSQFLARQIDIVQPEVIVALGATAATYLLGVKQPLSALRGAWHSVRGAKVAVTYHPAFLLRDPRQKSEAWKDLQRVMAEMGLQPKRTS